MAKLQVLVNGHSLGEYRLNKERLTIGRRPTCDIQIDNLTISGEHAVVVTLGADSYVEDLNSTNGTLVNNQPIKKHMLLNEDVIEFGDYQIHYCDELQTETQNSDGFEKTVMIKPLQIKPPQTESENLTSQKLTPQPAKASINQSLSISAESNQTDRPADSTIKPDMPGRLKVLNGNSAGRELKLDKAIVSFGKPGIQVAVIIKRPKGYFITHIEGKHYPTVNGIAIGSQAHALQHLDVVELAGTKMEFNLA